LKDFDRITARDRFHRRLAACYRAIPTVCAANAEPCPSSSTEGHPTGRGRAVDTDLVAAAAARDAAVDLGDRLTFGVEEEFLLVDADSGQVAPVADRVFETICPDLDEQMQREFLSTQVEI